MWNRVIGCGFWRIVCCFVLWYVLFGLFDVCVLCVGWVGLVLGLVFYVLLVYGFV